MDVVKVCEKMLELEKDIRLIDPTIKKAIKYPALNEIKFEGANLVRETFGIVRSQHFLGTDNIMNMYIDIVFVKSDFELLCLKVCIAFDLNQNNITIEKVEFFTTEGEKNTQFILTDKTINGLTNVVVKYIGLFAFVNYRLLNKAECFDVSCIRVEKKDAKKKNGKRGRNIIRSYKSYTFKSECSTPSVTRHNITCPAWKVRGHYRHYKNGKIIYIHPFVKGEKRKTESAHDNEYRVISGRESRI